MRNIWKKTNFVMKPVWSQPPSANLQLNFVQDHSLIFCLRALSAQSFDILSESTLSSLSEILQLRHFLLVYVGWWPRLLGCKKGLLNLHSQQPFLTQSVASCHITLPSCPPYLPCLAPTSAMCFSQTKLFGTCQPAPLTSNYSHTVHQQQHCQGERCLSGRR